MSDLPPELRDVGDRRRPVHPLWWRVTTAVIAVVLIAMVVIAYTF